MFRYILDVIILSLGIAGLWAIVAALIFRMAIAWRYWLVSILPMAFFVAMCLAHFRVTVWIDRLTSN